MSTFDILGQSSSFSACPSPIPGPLCAQSCLAFFLRSLVGRVVERRDHLSGPPTYYSVLRSHGLIRGLFSRRIRSVGVVPIVMELGLPKVLTGRHKEKLKSKHFQTPRMMILPV